jgi:uncharacterized protein DUF3592
MTRTEHLPRSERIIFKALGLPVIVIGLGVLGMLTWSQWMKLVQWPRTNGVLIHKDISNVGGRLVFKYEVRGQRVTGVGFLFGNDRLVRYALANCQEGTVQKISYDPEDPSQVAPIQILCWARFIEPVSGLIVSFFFIIGGTIVYRWSCAGPSGGGDSAKPI